MRKTPARILTLSGMVLIFASLFLYWQRTTPKRIAFELEGSTYTERKVQGEIVPTKLTIASLGIELPIYQAEIINDKWQVTTEGVSYLVSSSLPGDTGNSIIYGHNWESLLGTLVRAKPGDKIEVLLSDGTIVDFIVNSTQVVKPDQASVLATSSEKRLTIYTCTGFLDSKRFVVTALAEEV